MFLRLLSVRLSVPGKTFLVGEYLALDGGPSVLLSTNPRFELIVSRANSSKTSPLASESPASQFLKRHADFFSDFEFRFNDPHEGRGGLGASSAQFALLYAFWRQGSQSGWVKDTTAMPAQEWRALLDEYRACAWNGRGVPPSGADIVSQVHGDYTLFDGREFSAKSLKWDFPSLTWTLIRTGTKLATHEHLWSQSSVPTAPKAALHDALREIVGGVTKSFDDRNETQLVTAVQACARILSEAGLTAPGTLRLLEELVLPANDLCLAAKGCGAMGADVIFVLHRPMQEARLLDWIKGSGLEICGRQADLGQGLTF